MSIENGNFLNTASQVAMCKAHKDSEGEGNEYVDQVLNAKGDIDKSDVVEHMDKFSCREELDRYVENHLDD